MSIAYVYTNMMDGHRTLWEGVADGCPCRIRQSGSFVYMQWLDADGRGAVWPRAADGKMRDEQNVKEEAFKRALLDLTAELDRGGGA